MEVQATSSRPPTPLDPPKHLRRAIKSADYIDLERGTISEIERKPSLREKKSEIDHHQADSAPETSNLDASGSHRSGEPVSIPSGRPSAHISSSEGRRPGQPGTVTSQQGEDNRFHAFPERTWFQSAVVAQISFVIMTLMVLGNLTYTYIPLVNS